MAPAMFGPIARIRAIIIGIQKPACKEYTGTSTIAEAIAQGRRAGISIDTYSGENGIIAGQFIQQVVFTR
jgi:hypothetical protein